MKPNGIGPLLNFYNRLEKDDMYHKITGILLKHINQIGEMSIQDAADLCYTSTATISRLVKRAGYERYNVLKEEAKQQCANYFRENRAISPEALAGADAAHVYLQTVVSMFEALDQALDRDAISKAVTMIDEADTVYYFGTCDAARRFQQDLFIRGKLVEVYQVISSESPRVIEWRGGSVAIVENPGYPWLETNDMIRQIKQQGVKIILITCAADKEIADSADVCIRLSGTKSGRDEVLYAAVMTILSLEYRKRFMDTWFY